MKWHGFKSLLLNGTAEALAEQVSEENFEKGLIFPPFTNIRKISAHIAAKVAAKAYELGKIFLLFYLSFLNSITCFAYLKAFWKNDQGSACINNIVKRL